MAPRKIRTYTNTKKIIANRNNTKNNFDALFKENTPKVRKKYTRRNKLSCKLSRSPIVSLDINPTNDSTFDSYENSIKATWADTTFDKLRRGSVHNILIPPQTIKSNYGDQSTTQSIIALSPKVLQQKVRCSKRLQAKTLSYSNISTTSDVDQTEQSKTPIGEGFQSHILIIEPYRSKKWKSDLASLLIDTPSKSANNFKDECSGNNFSDRILTGTEFENAPIFHSTVCDSKLLEVPTGSYRFKPFDTRLASTPVKQVAKQPIDFNISTVCSPVTKSVHKTKNRKVQIKLTRIEDQPELKKFLKNNVRTLNETVPGLDYSIIDLCSSILEHTRNSIYNVTDVNKSDNLLGYSSTLSSETSNSIQQMSSISVVNNLNDSKLVNTRTSVDNNFKKELRIMLERLNVSLIKSAIHRKQSILEQSLEHELFDTIAKNSISNKLSNSFKLKINLKLKTKRLQKSSRNKKKPDETSRQSLSSKEITANVNTSYQQIKQPRVLIEKLSEDVFYKLVQSQFSKDDNSNLTRTPLKDKNTLGLSIQKSKEQLVDLSANQIHCEEELSDVNTRRCEVDVNIFPNADLSIFDINSTKNVHTTRNDILVDRNFDNLNEDDVTASLLFSSGSEVDNNILESTTKTENGGLSLSIATSKPAVLHTSPYNCAHTSINVDNSDKANEVCNSKGTCEHDTSVTLPFKLNASQKKTTMAKIASNPYSAYVTTRRKKVEIRTFLDKQPTSDLTNNLQENGQVSQFLEVNDDVKELFKSELINNNLIDLTEEDNSTPNCDDSSVKIIEDESLSNLFDSVSDMNNKTDTILSKSEIFIQDEDHLDMDVAVLVEITTSPMNKTDDVILIKDTTLNGIDDSLTVPQFKEPPPVSKRNTMHNVTSLPSDKQNSFVLRPGKQWRRSLSILRSHTNLVTSPQKGRRWRASIIEIFDQNPGACIRGIRPTTPDVNTTESEAETTKFEDARSPEKNKRKSVCIVQTRQTPERSRNEAYRIADAELKVVTPLESYARASTCLMQRSGYVSNAEQSNIEGLDGIFNNLSLSLTESSPACSSVDKTNRDKLEWEHPRITARDIVLQRCNQIEPLEFDYCYPESLLQKCHKIGEGVYGEVFLLKNAAGNPTVIKIIPIEGEILVNGENQKKFDEIISEIVIAQELSSLRNSHFHQTTCFAHVQAVKCVRGCYPARLVDLWELYDEDKGSENDHPSIFPPNQLYIVLELSHGGRDLESFQFLNAEQSYAIFVQTAYTLAVAECALKFEHRDLHWGNLLISPTDDVSIDFILHGETISVPSRGLKVTIIDFTLSRVTFDEVCIYNNLASDSDLFKSHGDYQFEVYKLMQRKNQNEWKHFEPYTNVLWLHYTILKMIDGARYTRSKSLKHGRNLKLMQEMANLLLAYKSSEEFVKLYFKK